MNDNPVEKRVINLQIPINTLGTFTKNKCEQMFDVEDRIELTEDEFKQLTLYGRLIKIVDNVPNIINIKFIDKYESSFNNLVENFIDEYLDVHDIYIKGFEVNEADILSEYDGEMSAHECAIFLMDFIRDNEVYQLSITFPPEED
jgi:hypothetical protein